MKFDDVNALLLGAASDEGAKPPPKPLLQVIAEALARIAVALEAGASDATVGARMVVALESLAKDVAALRQTSERSRG